MSNQKIKEALANATSGMWDFDGELIRVKGNIDITICRFFGHDETNFENSDPNGHLIANAPVWMASLITTIESQEEEIERLKVDNKKIRESYNKRVTESVERKLVIGTLQMENEQLKTNVREGIKNSLELLRGDINENWDEATTLLASILSQVQEGDK